MVTDIEVPTLILDVDACRQNIHRMTHKLEASGIVFRPHFKTHQSRAIGSWFREAGVRQITVSSLRMAEYFAADGWTDITVAFPVNLREKERIRNLSGQIHLHLLAEDPNVIRALDAAVENRVGVWLKVDVGTHRTGLDPHDSEKIDACVHALAQSQYLDWKGWLSHAGHTYSAGSKEEIRVMYRDALGQLVRLKNTYSGSFSGIDISFGDTPGASIVEDLAGIDEMRPGNFVFYDLMQRALHACTTDDIAIYMLCPVVACHPARNSCVIYGGMIHFAKDSLTTGTDGVIYGEVYDQHRQRRLGVLRRLSQEHGVIEMDEHSAMPVPGELVAVLPVHACMTAQMMGVYVDADGKKYDHFAGSGGQWDA